LSGEGVRPLALTLEAEYQSWDVRGLTPLQARGLTPSTGL